MRKLIVSLLIIVVSYKLYSHKEIRDIETRADYIIKLMEEYNSSNGEYPTDVDDILVAYDTGYMMFDSQDIPGKGYFVIHSQIAELEKYGSILIVGGYNPPNVIYFPKIKKKELNSDYFNDGSYYGSAAVVFLCVMIWGAILIIIFLIRYMRIISRIIYSRYRSN